jgi:acrylyl-CoA reductase (NADPH)
MGEANWGGLTEKARIKPASLVPLPEGLSCQHAMALGTAGFTAMLSLMALEEHGVRPENGEVVVTGATGGVGSISTLLLAMAGYDVVASTGKSTAHAYLKELGAKRIIDRNELGQGPARALDKGKWAGAVDSVGGPALAAILSQMSRHGSVAACGLANSTALETTVFPFILRGVNLLGIDSSTCVRERRIAAWQRLAEVMPRDVLEKLAEVISLSEVPEVCENMIAGQIRGRFVVDVHAS